jgi:hypothetical protein
MATPSSRSLDQRLRRLPAVERLEEPSLTKVHRHTASRARLGRWLAVLALVTVPLVAVLLAIAVARLP